LKRDAAIFAKQMIAIDTNVVVRFLVNDDPEQARRARRLIESESVFLSTSVLLETEWVLRAAYQRPRAPVLAMLRAFLGLPSVIAQDLRVAITALEWAERGMDFADALHLAGCPSCDAFATFDRALSKMARIAGAIPVRAP
jgi:predicted nucleic-acid-binding protein